MLPPAGTPMQSVPLGEGAILVRLACWMRQGGRAAARTRLDANHTGVVRCGVVESIEVSGLTNQPEVHR